MLLLGVALIVATLTSINEASISSQLVENWNGGFKLKYMVPEDEYFSKVNSGGFSLTFSGKLDGVEAWGVSVKPLEGHSNVYTMTYSDPSSQRDGGNCYNFIIVRCYETCTTEDYSVTLDDGSGPCTVSPSSRDCSSGSGGGDGSTSGGSTSGDSSSSGSTSGDSSSGSGASSSGSSSGDHNNSRKDYKDALRKAIMFYYAQRSGNIDENDMPEELKNWVVSSATHDDILGGWYDAGDYVKFNLPMAWSAMTQLWSLVKFKAGFLEAGQYEFAEKSVKWALDYFLRCWSSASNSLVVQVGDAYADHAVWGSPSGISRNRPYYSVDSQHPGSDVAGMTAAALASGSMVFSSSDPDYAADLLKNAKEIYHFARQYQGKYTDTIWQAADFYRSYGYKDELCVAAVWLYRATDDQNFLADARSFHESSTAWAYSWDDNRLACQMLLYEETDENQYKGEVENFFRDWLSIYKTQCDLVYRNQWGPLRYAASAAFVALVAADSNIQTVTSNSETIELAAFAVEQINVLLGDNEMSKKIDGCYSYMIGYGDNYPQQPHHRAASCTDSGHCYNDKTHASPHVLYGALVGGPDEGEYYKDERTDYTQSEVATDYNAGFVGALSGIVQLEASNVMPSTFNTCPCSP